MPRKTSALLCILPLIGIACIPLSRGRTYQSKLVTGKAVQNRLAALDGTTCEVSTETLQRVMIGEKHRCVWEPSDQRTLKAPKAPDAR